jgi:hypothetical protein
VNVDRVGWDEPLSKTKMSIMKRMLRNYTFWKGVLETRFSRNATLQFSRHEVGFQENTQKWEINGGGSETLQTLFRRLFGYLLLY